MYIQTIDIPKSHSPQRSNSLLFVPLFLIILALVLRNGHLRYVFKYQYIFMGVFVISVIISFHSTLRVDAGWLLLFIVFFFLIVLEFLNYSAYFQITNALKALLFFACMVLWAMLAAAHEKNYKYYWQCINSVSLIASVLICTVFLSFHTGLHLNELPVVGDVLFNAWEFRTSYRPAGLFSEASHFAEFALISVFYYLFKRKYVHAFFIIGAIFLSTSLLGIVGSLLIWMMHILTDNQPMPNQKTQWRKLLFIGGTMVAVVAALFCLTTSDSWLANRLLSGGTYGLRVIRSWEIFNSMDIRRKLIGVGLQNQANYLNYYHIVLPHDNIETLANREFGQTLGYILCTTGLIGCSMFCLLIVNYFAKAEIRSKCFILLFLYILLTCCIFSRQIFMVYLLVIFMLTKQNQKIESYSD